MIKKITMRNWKSFHDADLHIDPLTFLIGANAGGKSNALDSLRFLQRTAMGQDFRSALEGQEGQPGIRGGVEWAALRPNKSIELQALIQGESERIDYLYRMEVGLGERCELNSETLLRQIRRPRTPSKPGETLLVYTLPAASDQPTITSRLYNAKGVTRKTFKRSNSILSQINNLPLRKEIEEGVRTVLFNLRTIFVLDPIPSHMRNYSPLSDQLKSDASNIAGVIANLSRSKKKDLEQTLIEYARHLPESDLRRIWAAPVGLLRQDAMLYCQEEWGAEGKTTVDARGMSDGTLRFIAIMMALLTRPENSLLVVEEIDSGIHPSRAGLLMKMLREIGARRSIDVLATTHNPALLNQLDPEMIPFVLLAYRDAQSGLSQLAPLEELSLLPKLLGAGPLGKLSESGKIIEAARMTEGWSG